MTENIDRSNGKIKQSVGIDIGTSSIKVVSLDLHDEKKIITAYNIKKLPINYKDEDRATYIKEVLREIDLRPEMVNLSMAGRDVVVRFIDFPRINKEQLDNALHFEAEKYIPFNVNEVVLDSIILGDATEPGKMRVLLAAAKRKPIESLVGIVEKLGMKVNVIDISPFAMFNAFSLSNSLSEDKGTALICLGHSLTNILITIGERPCFMRQVKIGGKDIMEMLCKNLSISPQEAESYMLKHNDTHNEEVYQATMTVLDELVKEIQLSFGYFENRYNDIIGNIYCSGGLIYHRGILDYLGESLKVDLKKWNPVDGLEMVDVLSKQDIDSIASQLSVCIGLALRK